MLWAWVDMGRMEIRVWAGVGLRNAALTSTVLCQSLSLCAGQKSSAFSTDCSTPSPLCCGEKLVGRWAQQVEHWNSWLYWMRFPPCWWLICLSDHSPQLYLPCRAATDATSGLFSFSSFLGRVFCDLPAPSFKIATWVERFYTRFHM